MDIQILIHDARNGDKNAFGEIYDRYIDAVYRFVYFRIGEKYNTEDVTEQTFVSIFEHIREYEEKGLPFEAWLFRIARNKIIDYYRKQKPRVGLENIVDLEDPKRGPEKYTEESFDHEHMMTCIRQLPDSYQEIIILKFIEEKENEEISVLLDKPISHIRVLQSRALQKLRSIMHI